MFLTTQKLNFLILEGMTDPIISSPAILQMKRALIHLYDIDDVQERNDVGLNKSDKDAVRFMYSQFSDDSPEATPETIVRGMNILRRYKNTQFLGYSELEKEINKLLGDKLDDAENSKIIVDHTKSEYGKILVTFPIEITPRSAQMKQIKEIQNQFCIDNNISKQEDNYGNYDYPRYKIWSKDKSSMGYKSFYVSPKLIDPILTVFPNIPVEHLGKTISTDTSTSSIKGDTQIKQQKIKFIKTVSTPYGKKLMIQIGDNSGISFSTYSICKQKGLTPKSIIFDYSSKNHLLSTVRSEYDAVKQVFIDQGLDTSEIDKEMESEGQSAADDSSSGLSFSPNTGNKITIKYKKDNNDDQKKFLKQAIQYTFFDAEWQNYSYLVEGTYNQYMSFVKNLKQFGFDVSELEKIISDKLSQGLLQKTPVEGEESTEFKTEVRQKITNNFPDSKFDLYGIQQDGVSFLVSRNSAILGSETGAGKTVQMIYAAHIKTEKNNLPCLIITLKNVQAQWVQEIRDVLGNSAEISTDPMVTKKWNVLYYENFSAGKELENRMDKMKRTQYGVLILDELHKIKHSSSKRSENIQFIAQNIPVRWGASATVSSNKPLDVRNQLAMLDHPLGKISEGKFKRDFAGMVPEGYGGAYIEGNTDTQIQAAENLNKWMALSGVYLRQSKKDMKAERGETMSDLSIKEDSVEIDPSTLEKQVKQKIATYEDPELAISKLIAFREVIAKLKVDKTVSMVKKLVSENKNDSANNYSKSKVLVFTNFVESGKMLLDQISEEISRINPAWKVYSYLSSTPKEQMKRAKEIMLDPNSKVLVMSMKMGGTGISFPNTFSNMIVNDYDWTPESAEQSEGRIYRINTTQDVNIQYVIANGSDTQLFDRVKQKRQLAEIIQKYRAEYINTIEGAELLKKLVAAQKEYKKIDNDIINIVSSAIGSQISESFKQYFYTKLAIEEYLIQPEKSEY
jgi:hypothetical protein